MSFVDRLCNTLTRRLRVVATQAVGVLTLACIVSFALSSQAAQLAGDRFKPFVGTWEATFQKQPFFTLKLTDDAGKLVGLCDHSTGIRVDDNGSVTSVDDAHQEDRVLGARVSGNKLILTLSDGEDPSDSWDFEMNLAGPDTAEGRITGFAEKASWLMRRLP